MLMLWMCCRSFAQEEKNELRRAQINAIMSLATLFVTPSLQSRFANDVPASPWLSGGFGYGLYEGSSVLQKGVTNTEIHRNVETKQVGHGIDVRTRLKLLFPIGLRGEGRNYYTLKTPASVFDSAQRAA